MSFKPRVLLNHCIQQNIYARNNRGFVDLWAEFSVSADSFWASSYLIISNSFIESSYCFIVVIALFDLRQGVKS